MKKLFLFFIIAILVLVGTIKVGVITPKRVTVFSSMQLENIEALAQTEDERTFATVECFEVETWDEEKYRLTVMTIAVCSDPGGNKQCAC